VVTAITAQLITLAVLLSLPHQREVFTFGDVAEAIRQRAPVEREGEVLSVTIAEAPPRGWEIDTRLELRARATLGQILGAPPGDLLIEPDLFPGLVWIIRLRSPPPSNPAHPIEPSPRGAATPFVDLTAAAPIENGRWVIVATPPPSPGPGTLLLLWLAANALVLVPLAWLFTRRLVAPIRAFAAAAERAGRGEKGVVFPEKGPREVRKSARALAEMQERIAGAVEERTRLIAAVAHDLRTPLTRLRFRAEYAPPEHRERMVGDIERMDGMIGGVLAFARGEERLNRQRLDLATLVQSMVDDLVETGADATVVEAAPVEVLGDPLALRRLVANLLDNAVKYGGCARCSLRQDGKDALLFIDDDGPGIAEDMLERMFTPFERGDAARDPSTGGVGLGLALARGIARAHGGDVWLSRRPSHGLRAHVRLPAAVGSG
jgi:signal transduction histidine kinase